MMVMTARVNKKKLLLILAAAAALIAILCLLTGGDDTPQPTVRASLATNDGRVQFLESLGWQVAASPKESGQVRIPETGDQVFQRYNALQKSQGYDLSAYAGKAVLRYVYQIKNYPGAKDPVYATLLIYKDQVIGGDVTDTSAKGVIQGLKKAQQAQNASDPTVP